MATVQLNNTVGTTATRIVQLPASLPYTAVQVANGHSSSIFIGGNASVTPSGANHGQTLGANSNVQIWLRGGDSLWAIASVASGTGDVSVIYSGI